jgi:hypothetical protein
MPGKTQALYPAARDVARLVAGREPDQALVAHYEIWAATLAAQRIISERVLKRSEARAAFAYVARAAGRLAAPLSTWTISDLLKDPTLGAFPELDDLRRLLDTSNSGHRRENFPHARERRRDNSERTEPSESSRRDQTKDNGRRHDFTRFSRSQRTLAGPEKP